MITSLALTMTLSTLAAAAGQPAEPMIAVVTKTIPRGASVDSTCVSIVPKSSREIPRRVRAHDWRKGERLRARRLLRPGSIVGRFDVEPMPDIAAGDPVMVELTKGSMRVTANAVAKEDGFSGETIWVQNGKTRRRLRVRVVEPGRVELLFGGSR